MIHFSSFQRNLGARQLVLSGLPGFLASKSTNVAFFKRPVGFIVACCSGTGRLQGSGGVSARLRKRKGKQGRHGCRATGGWELDVNDRQTLSLLAELLPRLISLGLRDGTSPASFTHSAARDNNPSHLGLCSTAHSPLTAQGVKGTGLSLTHSSAWVPTGQVRPVRT